MNEEVAIEFAIIIYSRSLVENQQLSKIVHLCHTDKFSLFMSLPNCEISCLRMALKSFKVRDGRGFANTFVPSPNGNCFNSSVKILILSLDCNTTRKKIMTVDFPHLGYSANFFKLELTFVF